MPMAITSSEKTGTKLHMCATKSFLIGAIRTYGASEVLTGWEGTDDEAVKAIEDDPREVIAFGCDDYDETGRCKGHRG